MVFSEKDIPGQKSRSFVFDQDDDETGQGRSKLYDDAKRNRRKKERKENPELFTPYRRAIPKKTAVAGTVTKEFDAVAVKNADYERIERMKLSKLLAAPKASDATTMLAPHEDPTRRQNVTTMRQRQQENKVSAVPRCFRTIITSSRPPQRADKPSRTVVLVVWTPRTWFDYFWSTSSSTGYGACEISKHHSSSRNHSFGRLCRILHSCISTAISMESGS